MNQHTDEVRVPQRHSRSNFERLAAFAVIWTICVVTDFLHVQEFPLMGDDWGIVSHHFYRNAYTEIYAIPYPAMVAIRSARFNARPVSAVQPLLDWVTFELGGRLAWSLAASLVLALNAWLLYCIQRKHYPFVLALLGGLLALLFPGDTTHQWLTLGYGRLAFSLSLVACLAFGVARYRLAAFLLMCAVLWYEIAIVLFLLAPCAAPRTERRVFARMCGIIVLTVGIWLLFRIALFAAGERGYGGGTMNALLAVFQSSEALGNYLASFPRAIWLGLWELPSQAVELVLTPFPDRGTAVLFALAASVAIVMLLIRGTSGRRDAECTTQGVKTADESPLLPFRNRGPFADAVYGLLIVAGSAAASFFLGPTAAWGLDTRANYSVAFGAAMTLTGLIAAMLSSRHRLSKWICGIMVGALLTSWLVARYQMQLIAVSQTRTQKAELLQTVKSIGTPPASSTIVIGDAVPTPAGTIVRSVDSMPFWELQAFFRAVYGDKLSVVADKGAEMEAAEPRELLDSDTDRDIWLIHGKSSEILPATPWVIRLLNE